MINPGDAITSGTLLLYAGAVLAMLRSHDKRIERTEGDIEKLRDWQLKTEKEVGQLAVMEGKTI